MVESKSLRALEQLLVFFYNLLNIFSLLIILSAQKIDPIWLIDIKFRKSFKPGDDVLQHDGRRSKELQVPQWKQDRLIVCRSHMINITKISHLEIVQNVK